MAIVTSEKIFVDPKEEVTTILERILKSEKSRVILVVPLNSLLLSSYVTINILFREIVRSQKLVVIVTEDDYGTSIGRKAGYEVVAKVSLVTSIEWEKALANKKGLLASLEDRKNRLLSNFQGDEAYEENVLADNKPQASQPVVENIEPIKPIEQVKTVDQATKDAEDAIVQKFKKPRREPKVVTIEGIEIFSGGDILSLDKSSTYDKMVGLDNSLDETMNQQTDENKNFRRNIPTGGASSFTGKDFTKSVKKKTPFGGFFNFFGGKAQGSGLRTDEAQEVTNRKRKKYMIIGGVVLAFLFLGGGYVLAFQSSSVDITLELKKEDINTSASIIVDSDSTDMTLDPLTIPGIVLTEDNLSISRTGEANGEGKKGTKADGLIDIWNLHVDGEIVLNAGTKLTSVSTNLVYVLRESKTIPGTKLDPDGTRQATSVENIPVIAIDFGEEYNTTGTDSNTQFSIEGYKISDLYGRRYSNWTGGTSQTFVAVSAENVKTVKDLALPDIKRDGETKLKLQVPTGYRYLTETLEFTEKETKANPDVGAEATDKTFNLSLAGSVKAIAVKETDLEKAITHIVEQDKSRGGAVSVQGIEDLKIDKIEKADNKLILTVSSKSSLQKTLTIDGIKEDIAGKSFTDARDYLGLLDEVEKFKITFNPDIVPESLRRVPADVSRINIKTK